MSDLYDWCTDYTESLPPAIRPSADDARFVAAARRARDNGWTATHAARVVCTVNFSTALNPPLIALVNLERIAERAPQQRQQAADASGCIVCPPGTRCPNPVGTQDRIRPAWLVQRMELIRELLATRELDEDERAQCMAVLIEHQKGEAA